LLQFKLQRNLQPSRFEVQIVGKRANKGLKRASFKAAPSEESGRTNLELVLQSFGGINIKSLIINSYLSLVINIAMWCYKDIIV
jgi:hypothetical protein